MSAAREPRLLIYSQDGLGLGHLRRTTLLANQFLHARPGASALTISDSPLGRFFTTMPGHDYLKLPSIRKAAPGDWRPVSLASSVEDVLAMRRILLRSAVLAFRPHVVLVDHMPHGAMGELVPTLQALRGQPVRLILGLRDILDAPAVIRDRWRAEGAYDAVERHYDQVLVYGSREVFDVAVEYAWPEAATSRLEYCGYICAPGPASVSQRVRKRYLRGTPERRLVLVMAGGGADAYPLFDALLDAVPSLHRRWDARFVMVTGPFLPPAQRRELSRRAQGLPVHVLTTVADSPGYMAAADLVVAMAGYNTTAEILSVGTPALLVPRQGPSAEQQTRARLFAQRGWVRWLPPHRLGGGAMVEAVSAALDAPTPARPVPPPDLSGRVAGAARLLAALDEPGDRVAGRAGEELLWA